MLVLYSSIAFDSRLDGEPEQAARRVQAFIHNTEILLGAESGSLEAPMAGLFPQVK